jgi:hypothetical protein
MRRTLFMVSLGATVKYSVVSGLGKADGQRRRR